MTEPIGIKVPIQMGTTGFFNQTYTSLEEATANMYNLLLTQRGERLMQPSFGTRIYGLLFEPITKDLKRLVEDEIRQAVDMWLPYVELVEVNVNISNENIENNRIEIKVGFGLRRDLTQYNEIIVTFVT